MPSDRLKALMSDGHWRTEDEMREIVGEELDILALRKTGLLWSRRRVVGWGLHEKRGPWEYMMGRVVT